MNENVKRLFHVRALMHPLYAEIIATRPEIRFDKLENDTPDPAAEPICPPRTPIRSVRRATRCRASTTSPPNCWSARRNC